MKLIAALLLLSCTTAPTPVVDRGPRYKPGDCLMLIDPDRGVFKTRHRVRVEKVEIDLKRYSYRWLLDNGKWDSMLSFGVGNFSLLEKITTKAYDCPT
jgi:hypothetical protein